jgi:hypothetical protein
MSHGREERDDERRQRGDHGPERDVLEDVERLEDVPEL